jgi:single-strand DNA-binding protein
MQKTIIIGNIGQDAELKTIDSGSFYSFTVAVNDKESTTWFSVAAASRFEKVAPYLKKGTKVYIEGKYTPKLYTNKDGQQMISHSLSMYQVELLGSTAPSAKPDGLSPEHVSGLSGTIKDDLEDDLPF